MIKIQNNHLSLPQICESGQCFRMEPLGMDRYCLMAGNRYLEMEQKQQEISFDCGEEEFHIFWEGYFDLNTDYEAVIRSIDENDGYLKTAAAFGSGIRILRQDLWEMIISFIISQQNNIKRIRRCIHMLCERYGERLKSRSGKVYFAFPTPEALAAAGTDELYACNLGYRSRYIRESAGIIAQGIVDLEAVKQMKYETARSELMRLCGIGRKVADCICLFALHQTEAFPVDTHIMKVLDIYYPQGFPYGRYGSSSGIMQQYIFYYDLMGPHTTRCPENVSAAL